MIHELEHICNGVIAVDLSSKPGAYMHNEPVSNASNTNRSARINCVCQHIIAYEEYIILFRYIYVCQTRLRWANAAVYCEFEINNTPQYILLYVHVAVSYANDCTTKCIWLLDWHG